MEPVIGLGLDLRLPRRGSRGRLRALHAQLRDGIVQARLHPGLLLPSTRQLARAYGVSRNTAVAAYDMLASEGYVVTRPGGGTFVAAVTSRRKQSVRNGTPNGDGRRLRAYWRARQVVSPPPEPLADFDFAVGMPDKSLFPFDIWRRLSARGVRALSRTPAMYAEAEGRESLRKAVWGYVSYARAVSCSYDDVVITSGAQQAFDLLARILVTFGQTTVAVEDPGYSPMRRAFEAHGARIAAVPVDAEGIRVDRMPPAAKVICVTPSHQFPLGMSLSMARRKALLEHARRYNALIVEDDYDGEFRHGGRPLDALQMLDNEQRVFYVGTFSKSVFPALRLGYVVTPPWARTALVAAKQSSDWHCAVLAQDTLAAFITEGHLTRHVRKMRRTYGERREIILEGIRRHLDGRIETWRSDTGMHIACALTSGRSTADLEAHALTAGIRLRTLDRFAVRTPRLAGFVLGFGRIPSDRIDRGLRRLASILR
jgi:GntR family transcriptional regulator/MocR family aminotransferase